MTSKLYRQTSRVMTVLGIDPGITRLGYAVIEGSRNAPRLVTSGIIGNPKAEHLERLGLIYNELTALIAAHPLDLVAVEKLYFSKNVRTALTVAEARGIILLTAHRADIKVYECTPQQVKIALTGNGRATKTQVAHMLNASLKFERRPRLDDETDAIAIALTALVSYAHTEARDYTKHKRSS